MTRMKESGIDWIGQIPQEWEVRPIKNIVETPVTDGPHETPVLYETGIPFLSAEAVKDGILDFNYKRGYISLRDHERFKKKVSPKKDDIYIVKSGATTGNVGIVTTDEIFDIWSPLALIRSTKTLAIQKYIYFYLLSTIFKAQVEFNWSFGTQQNIGMGVIERIKVILPSISEQERIVEILDKKTAQLDKVKALLEEQIQKLKDYRACLIYEIVTKGLDKTAPMKDSGIDWIGQVPEGWGVDFANHIFEEHKQKNKGSKEKNLLSLSYGRIIRKSIDTSFGLLPESFDTYNIIQRGDIVLRLTDLQNDKRSLRVGLARENGIITSAYLTLRLKNLESNDSYMYYLLHTYDICKVFYNFGGGVRQGGTWSDIYKLKLLIPPYNEQTKITDFLDKKTVQIDKLIKIKNQQIKNINRQRQTLIYDYVTGKRRV